MISNVRAEHPQDKPKKALDPCVRRLMAAFQQWGWLPVDAERNIYDERLRLATRIDLIVVELATKRVIWLELKSTGSEEEYGPLSSDPFFLAPLQGTSEASTSSVVQCSCLTHSCAC